MSQEIRKIILTALSNRDMTTAEIRAHTGLPRHKVVNCVTRMELLGFLCRVDEVRQLPDPDKPRKHKRPPSAVIVGYPSLLYSLDMSRAKPYLMRPLKPPIVINAATRAARVSTERQTKAPAGLVELAIAGRSEFLPAWLGGKGVGAI